MENPSDYRKAYESAKRELSDLIVQQDHLEKKKLSLRKLIETLAAFCEDEGIAIDPSEEADYIRMRGSLADEIRTILHANYPGWLRPHRVKGELESIGHDLAKYSNPQATIHMVLKRMAESKEIQEMTMPDDGKKAYRCPSLSQSLIENFSKPVVEITPALEALKEPGVRPRYRGNQNPDPMRETIQQSTKKREGK